jgi:hypothetical protein
MNLKVLGIAASFCLTFATLTSAQCNSCGGGGNPLWRGYAGAGCNDCCDPCCDPCCTNRYGLLRGVGRIVVGAVRVVDNLIPRPCVNCACSPCGDSCGGGCDSCGDGVIHGDMIHSEPAPDTIVPTNASRPVGKARPVTKARRSGEPTPARLPRQVTAKPIIEDVELVDHEEAAHEAPALKPIASKKVESKKVEAKKTESKKLPVNPLR